MFGKVVAILVILGIILACGFLYVVFATPPWVTDFLTIQLRHRSEDDFAEAFAVALRSNDRVAYEMVDPALHPRLDEWMHSHHPWYCNRSHDFFMSAPNSDGTYRVVFDCWTDQGGRGIEIDDIVIQDMRILDWGEVTEDE
jgi:hypothetical protein